tara:strand:- start:2960 stop:3781 length:822 start_codon:yes stop_codon:yes gene_type:complete
MPHPLAELIIVAHILVKFGGGLITDKSQLKTINQGAITELSVLIHYLINNNHQVTIVHGAGSFGHLKAKKWQISEGAISEIEKEQLVAVAAIRKDMKELNSYITKELVIQGVESISFPPSNWARGIGPNFKGSLADIASCPQNTVAITFGDVVDCEEPRNFGILSGDDLMVRLAKEIDGITHCIFLLGDTEGLLTAPPSDPKSKLVPTWSRNLTINGEHNTSEDVTGGIFLKLESAAEITQVVSNVWFLDGRNPNRVKQLIEAGHTIGTRIVP